jgi:hypothetical protein
VRVNEELLERKERLVLLDHRTVYVRAKGVLVAPALQLLWLYGPFLDLGHFISISVLYTVGTMPWMGDQPVIRSMSAHRTIQTRNKHIDINVSSGIRTHDSTATEDEAVRA